MGLRNKHWHAIGNLSNAFGEVIINLRWEIIGHAKRRAGYGLFCAKQNRKGG